MSFFLAEVFGYVQEVWDEWFDWVYVMLGVDL